MGFALAQICLLRATPDDDVVPQRTMAAAILLPLDGIEPYEQDEIAGAFHVPQWLVDERLAALRGQISSSHIRIVPRRDTAQNDG
jgi:hypothetical protein